MKSELAGCLITADQFNPHVLAIVINVAGAKGWRSKTGRKRNNIL
ncbi:hypothetical protein [Citrobacter koseri]|nr:hypothetical protein [Citrobacter koseri]MDI9801295.1 hypothetical protein [Citrobacter koseri]